MGNISWRLFCIHFCLKYFVTRRQQDTNAIIDMSEKAYQEFEPDYDMQKQYDIELLKAQLYVRYPQWFKSSRYLLACTHVPYSFIKKQYDVQQQFLKRIVCQFPQVSNVHWQTVDRWMDKNHDLEFYA